VKHLQPEEKNCSLKPIAKPYKKNYFNAKKNFKIENSSEKNQKLHIEIESRVTVK